MYSDPWATFGMRRTPRMRLMPDDTMNRIVVRLSPTRIWDSVPAEKRCEAKPIGWNGYLDRAFAISAQEGM
jgi:hypothetical protein